MDNTIPIGVFASSFTVAAFAGMASLLRSGTRLTVVSVASQAANSGLLGLGISLIWYAQFIDNVYALIGVCLMAGLGGMTAVDFVLQAVRRGGFSINFGKDSGLKMNEPEQPKAEQKP